MADFQKVLKDLRDERDRLDRVIQLLEELGRGTKRRGRPPKRPKGARKKGDAKT